MRGGGGFISGGGIGAKKKKNIWKQDKTYLRNVLKLTNHYF